MPTVVCLSLAVTIFMKNVYFEEPFGICVLYFFSVECCDVIELNMQKPLVNHRNK
jgi:hypothetical protein